MDSLMFVIFSPPKRRLWRRGGEGTRSAGAGGPDHAFRFADQACRSSVSCFLQPAEGLPNEGAGMRRKCFTESNHSLHETVAALDLAQTLGAIDGDSADSILQPGLRLKKMLRALLRPS